MTPEELRKSMRADEPSSASAIPFKSDILNLLTGGIQCGFITEISGNPSMFKSTLACECVGHALNLGGHVIVFDKERKMTESRFTTLGINNATKNNEHFWYFKDIVPATKADDLINIERLFENATTIHRTIREDDLNKVRARFLEGKAKKEEMEHYAGVLGVSDQWRGRTDKEGQCATIAGKDGKNFVTASQLRQQDKSLILIVVDSTTAVPAREEAFDAKTGLPNLSPQPALQARVWSQLLRNCLFMDERVAMLQLAQIRTAGIMGKGHPYKRAAVTAAQEFYNTVRLQLYAGGAGSVLYRDPRSGGILKADKLVATSDQLYQLGNIVSCAIKKNLDSMQMDVPLFMLGATGTDPVNSLWEFFHESGFVKHTSGGWWQLQGDFFACWPQNFKIESWFQIYSEVGQEIWKALLNWKKEIIHGKQGNGKGTQPAFR
jgi:RecA/RadA recombinase